MSGTPLRLSRGDGNLAFTPLMLDLKNDLRTLWRSLGQAVGAAYFAARSCKAHILIKRSTEGAIL
jgi:hypothetical protein